MSDTTAVLLVGGLGTRLRPVISSSPKVMATVGDKPFLELLVHQLRCQNIKQIVMCTGYLAQHIEDEFEDGSKLGVTIKYSRESSPLGTAGALKLAESHLQHTPDFLVLNGDSFLQADLRQLIQFHRAHQGIMSMATVYVEDTTRYGSVNVGADDRVTAFVEKSASTGRGLVNAGIYAFSRSIFEHLPAPPASLEKDVFTSILLHGVFAFQQEGTFIDIGTPDDYQRAKQICDQLQRAAEFSSPGSQQ